MTPSKTLCNDSHCNDHSGRLEKEKAFEATLKRIERKLDDLLSLERVNEKRIDRVYIVFDTVWVMSSFVVTGIGVAVKLGWV